MTTIESKSIRGSSLERAFLFRWAIVEGPPLEREYRFHPKRKWRFDFADLHGKVAIELDGGIWRGTRGAHGGAGAIRDREKDLEATLLGWTVVRLTKEMIHDRETMRRLAEMVRNRQPVVMFR